MRFWNYIGEFLLFRWLFDKFRKSTIEHDTHTEVSGTSIDRDSEYLNGNHDEGIAPDDAVTDVGDNLIDDSDNSENLDYLGIYSCAIIVPVCITETMTVIIIAAVVMAFSMIGIPGAILNHMTSRTTMT